MLVHAYAEPPFRVGRWFQRGADAHMILAWSAPGVFGGDSLHQTIRIERGASVHLTSRSSTQVHASPNASLAQLSSRLHVEAGGSLVCAWDPLIPFAGARLSQRIDIEVTPTGRLCWSDAFMCGRVARGERWRFDEFNHHLRVTRSDALVYLERHHLQHDDARASQRWRGHTANYFGSVLAVAHGIGESLAFDMQTDLASVRGVRGAADITDDGLLVARLMAEAGPAFRDARTRVFRRLVEAIGKQ
jgi:urease accessory protein